MLIILSEDTRKSGSILSYEIEQAIDVYKIPLIIAYPGYSAIWGVGNDLAAMWLDALAKRIDKNGTQAIHIAFQQKAIIDAIPRFTVNGEKLSDGRNYYSKETYERWGLLK